MKNINIHITDDDPAFRSGLRMLLQRINGTHISAESSNGRQLLSFLEHCVILPDIVFLDIRMPDMNGVTAARLLKASYPQVRIIVISSFFSRSMVRSMLNLGIAAYLSKYFSIEELERTLHAVSEYGTYLSAEVQQLLV